MGVKYNRDYNDIVMDLAQHVYKISGFTEIVGMTDEEWAALSKPEQLAILQTMCDDILFALGEDPAFEVSGSRIVYCAEAAVIEIWTGVAKIGSVKLV